VLVAVDFDHDGHAYVGGLDGLDEFFPANKTEHYQSRWTSLRAGFP